MFIGFVLVLNGKSILSNNLYFNRYIYTDDVSVESINDAFSLLKASKKWGLKDMETKTLEMIKKFLDDYDPSTDERKKFQH